MVAATIPLDEAAIAALATAWQAQLFSAPGCGIKEQTSAGPLAGIAQRATELLLDPAYEPQHGRRLGAELAALDILPTEALGCGLAALSDLWAERLPPGQRDQFLHRSPALLGDISAGFVSGALDQERQELRQCNARLREQLQAGRQRLQSFLDVEAAILSAESVAAIAEIALAHVVAMIPARSASLSIYDSTFREGIILAGYRIKSAVGTRFPVTNSAEHRRLRRNEAVIFGDLLQRVDDVPALRLAIEQGHRSILSAPLHARGALVGVLTLASAELDAFGIDEIEIARQVANSVAIALQNARLLETEKKARVEAETMREVAAKLGSSLNQDDLLDVVLAQLARVLAFDSAAVLLLDAGDLRIAAAQDPGPYSRVSLDRFPQVPPNLARMMEDQTPRLIADTNNYPEWVRYPGREIIRCWLGVPLIGRDGLLGILTVDKAEPHYYDEHDLRIAQAFAGQAAVVLENARLLRQVEDSAQNLRHHVAKRTRQLRSLYETTAITTRHLDLHLLLTDALEHIARDVGCAAGAVLLLNPDKTRLLLCTAQGLDAAQQEELRDIAASLLPNEGHTAVRLFTRAADTLPLPSTLGYCAAVPLRTQGGSIGSLLLMNEVSCQLTADETRLLASQADHLAVAIENARLRAESEQLAVARERERLARDLHDSATQSLYSLTLFSAAAREQLRGGNLALAEEYLSEVDQTADQVHRELRLLLHELQDQEAGDTGLVQAIQRRLQLVEGRSGISVTLEAPDDLHVPLPARKELYKIASEALTNALKHAQAASVSVRIAASEQEITLSVEDDGLGFDLETARLGSGLGLINMQQRARNLGGVCDIVTAPQQGTCIHASVPRSRETG